MKLALDAGGRFTAIELPSEALAIGFARAWPCEVGVFTNLTHDHLDAHGSPEHYLASKAQLFVALPPDGSAVLNAADPVFELLREVVPKGVRVRSYAVPSRSAVQGSPDIVATRVRTSWEGTHISCETRDPVLPRELRVRSIGDVNAENALPALLGAVAAGAAPEDAACAIAEAPPPPGRFEVIDRAEAIATAIREASDRDVVLIAGKRHETAQTIGEESRQFADAEVASQALRAR